jgi:uncharacterized protein (TIGR02145 family)
MSSNEGTFIDDRDKHVYRWVRIGNQIWMGENFAYMPYVSLPREIKDPSEGGPLHYTTPPGEPGEISGIWVYGYNGKSVAKAKRTAEYKAYGCLYDWGTAFKAVPKGWHLATDDEWLTLIDYLGGKNIAGGRLKEVGTSHWKSPNKNATNDFGFSARPGGIYFPADSPKVAFSKIGYYGYWLSTLEFGYQSEASAWVLFHDITDDYTFTDGITITQVVGHLKWNGFSVRCIRD